MKLIGYTCTYNEEKMIPYVMPYVERLGYDKFIVYDNMSTDNTVEELKKYPFVEVRTYDTGGKFDDDYRNRLLFYALGDAKQYTINGEDIWMTWTDFDEVIYISLISRDVDKPLKWLLEAAHKQGFNVCAPQMVNLISEKAPSTEGLVHENVEKCFIWGQGKKATIFYVNTLRDIFTNWGFHYKRFVYDEAVKEFSDEMNICAFHLKYLDYKYLFNKNKINNERLIYFSPYETDEKKYYEFIKHIEGVSFPLHLYFANKLNSKLNLLSGIEHE